MDGQRERERERERGRQTDRPIDGHLAGEPDRGRETGGTHRPTWTDTERVGETRETATQANTSDRQPEGAGTKEGGD